ncbi:ABC transporter ATP-binding protein [Pedobacter aquae]|uniref:ABC transporter ATP-binding protein n=1 Tax=Pedobacter aquae TaxID=2605747 RepID=A0A5C0VGT6_9SPHI|nr:ABC transporter ATP-binding protein [Pedobacter aquae]QEK51948.1 ABC transporter ATP-binding protein [Pedobacter aquae]
MTPLITVHNIYKNFTDATHSGVSGINLEINEGEIVSIVGESGSGKTTLLKLIYGYLIPQGGEVLFEGKRVLGPTEKLIPGHDEMKMVTQELTLNLYARVYDNISSLLSNTDLEVKRDLTMQTMEFLRIDHLAYKKIVELSGGEQQRVAIARAVITEPRVLLLDEPFSQVDTILKKQLRDDIERLARFLKITVIMVSHDPSDGLSLSDKLVIVKDGKVVREGKPQEIYYEPQHAYVAQLIGKANILNGLSFLENGKYAVYPQDVFVNQDGMTAKVKSVHFGGLYQEVEYIAEDKTILSYDFDFIPLAKGDEVNIAFKKLMKLDS